MKQGCVLTLTLFGNFFVVMLKHAFGTATEGVYLQICTTAYKNTSNLIIVRQIVLRWPVCACQVCHSGARCTWQMSGPVSPILWLSIFTVDLDWEAIKLKDNFKETGTVIWNPSGRGLYFTNQEARALLLLTVQLNSMLYCKPCRVLLQYNSLFSASLNTCELMNGSKWI